MLTHSPVAQIPVTGAPLPYHRKNNIALFRALRSILPPESVLDDAEDLRPFECDGLAVYRQLPMVVVLPETIEQVQTIMRLCHAQQVPVVARGAGTGLSGGALPLADGVLLSLAKFKNILSIDPHNAMATVQPGVRNLAISETAAAYGLYYAPDPSSQIACTIGGNVAENSGGLHCLKYGLTTNNLLGVEIALPGGERVTLGGKAPGSHGLDLLGIVAGSEGLLGIVVEATLRLLPKPPATRTLLAAFNSVPEAGQCVADIIAAGIVPAAMEFMDKRCVSAVEAYSAPGYPKDAEGILLIDADGIQAEVDDAITRLGDIARKNGASVREATNEAERMRFWAGRKAAFPAMGRLAPDMLCMDGTIPRRALPQVLVRMSEMAKEYRLGFCNVFHAGDGNLHPLITFDMMKDDELARAEAFGNAILRLCVEVGGVLTGEHGVGLEKRDLMPAMFTDADLDQQQRLKCAFDSGGILNPGKVFPILSACVEQGHMHVKDGRLPFANLPRF